MIHARLSVSGLLIALMLPLATSAAAPATCAEEIAVRMGLEERLYRSVLFGASAAKDMPINSVIVDDEGDTWLKTATNNWRSPAHTGFTWYDSIVEDRRGVPARRGILEVQKALSSELLPSMLQAVRAMQCRMQAVCLAVPRTREAEDTEPVTVQPDGCIEFEMPQMKACKTAELSTFDNGACNGQVRTIVDREMRMLELLVTYDASYRTLMQFAGTFEGFLSDFRFPLLQPLWQMVRTLGSFDSLPCFLAECNE